MVRVCRSLLPRDCKGLHLSIVSANESQTSGRNNGWSFVIYSPIQYSNQVLSVIIKTGMIVTQKHLFFQSINVVAVGTIS